MALNPDHFRPLICKVLSKAESFWGGYGFYTVDAVELMMGTAAVESDFGTNIYQIGGGPGLGFFQMEPHTARSLWKHQLSKRPGLINAIVDICHVAAHNDWYLEHNVAYQIMMARIRYLPYPAPIPPADDIPGQALYWDRAYNRNPDAGFPEDYIKKYRLYCT